MEYCLSQYAEHCREVNSVSIHGLTLISLVSEGKKVRERLVEMMHIKCLIVPI